MLLQVFNLSISIEKNVQSEAKLMRELRIKGIEDELNKVKNKYLHQNLEINQYLIR